ncbi:hypothetical protein AB1N83_008434 [Pleurotus pulmonarius]
MSIRAEFWVQDEDRMSEYDGVRGGQSSEADILARPVTRRGTCSFVGCALLLLRPVLRIVGYTKHSECRYIPIGPDRHNTPDFGTKVILASCKTCPSRLIQVRRTRRAVVWMSLK